MASEEKTPGKSTSEFLVVLTPIIGTAIAIFQKSDWKLQIALIAGGVILGSVYIWSRTVVKTK